MPFVTMGGGQGASLLADPEQSGAPPSSFLPPCAPTPLASENYGFGLVLQRRSGRLPFALFCLLASVRIAVCLIFKQIRYTGVHLFVVTLTMVLALVLSQACYLVDELCHLQERHGGRCWPAVLLCLRFPPATYLTVGVLMLLSVLMALQHWDMVLGFLRDQWNLLLLVWLVCQLCTWWCHRLGLSLASRGGPTPGEGLAYSAFCTFFRRLPDSLCERISKYEDDHGVKLAVKKLFILLPSSCYIDPLLGSGQDEDLEPTTSIEDVNIPRAGTKERIFTNTVYKIRNGDGEPYYCLAEGATPLLTLHDMWVHSELSAEQQQEQMLIFYHKLKELLERHQACSTNFLLVPYCALREPISKYEDDHGVELAVKKLFILLPSSCYIDPLLESGQDEDLEPTTSIEDVNVPRAGTKERIFTNTVYKIRNGDGEPYYCLEEGATPLLTLHDMGVHSELSAEQQREQMLIFYHKLKELLERHQACSTNFLLVPYCDKSANGSTKKVSSVLRDEIRRHLKLMEASSSLTSS